MHINAIWLTGLEDSIQFNRIRKTLSEQGKRKEEKSLFIVI